MKSFLFLKCVWCSHVWYVGEYIHALACGGWRILLSFSLHLISLRQSLDDPEAAISVGFLPRCTCLCIPTQCCGHMWLCSAFMWLLGSKLRSLSERQVHLATASSLKTQNKHFYLPLSVKKMYLTEVTVRVKFSRSGGGGGKNTK